MSCNLGTPLNKARLSLRWDAKTTARFRRPQLEALSVMNRLPHDYENLAPTVMDMDLIYKYLDELIILAKSADYDRFEVCEAFCELIQVRMSDNLCGIDAKYGAEVFDILSKYWPDFEEHLDSYLTTLLNLGLHNRLRIFLNSKKRNALQPYEINLINEIYDEL